LGLHLLTQCLIPFLWLALPIHRQEQLLRRSSLPRLYFSGRNIAYSVLFTRLSAAIITKTGRHLAADFDSSGVDLFVCSLIDREAFKSVFSFGGTVNELEVNTKREQASIEKAAENARVFAEEVKRKLKASIEERKVVNG
jgi:hypothetical protein